MSANLLDLTSFSCVCGKTFFSARSLASHKAKCKTYLNSENRFEIRTCVICGDEFKINSSRRDVTCGKSCGSRLNALHKGYNIHNIFEKRTCKVCGSEFECSTNSKKTLCSKECISDYNRFNNFKRSHKIYDIEYSFKDFLDDS